MKKVFWSALMPVLALTFTSCSPDTSDETIVPQTQTVYTIVTNYNYSNDEIQLIKAINDYRESIGLNRLETVNHISNLSGQHNAYMISKNVMNHDFFDERANNIIHTLGAKKVAENVARNFVTIPPLLQAWLNSPGHRANIEGDFSHIGLAVSVDSVSGKKYCTNMFIRK